LNKTKQKYDLSEKTYLKTIEIQERTLGSKHVVLGESWYELGLVFEAKENGEEAKKCFQKAHSILSEAEGKTSSRILEEVNKRIHKK